MSFPFRSTFYINWGAQGNLRAHQLVLIDNWQWDNYDSDYSTTINFNYWNYSTGSWATAQASLDGHTGYYLGWFSQYPLTSYNCRQWGMCWGNSYGSYYNMRSSWSLYKQNSDGSMSYDSSLPSNYKPVFQGETSINPQGMTPDYGIGITKLDAFQYARIYGYLDGNNVYHDLSGCYIKINITADPKSYNINTY